MALTARHFKWLQLIGGLAVFTGVGDCVGLMAQHQAPTPDDSTIIAYGSVYGCLLWLIGTTGRWWLRP